MNHEPKQAPLKAPISYKIIGPILGPILMTILGKVQIILMVLRLFYQIFLWCVMCVKSYWIWSEEHRDSTDRKYPIC